MNYRKPDNPGFLGAVQWRPIATGALVFLSSQVFATEFLAYRFQELGMVFADSRILAFVHGFPVYLPLCWAKWVIQCHAWLLHGTKPYAAPLAISSVVGILGAFIGFTMRGQSFNWRAKKLGANQEDIYGSSRFANRDDLVKAGLQDGTKGILLGGWQETPDAPVEYLYDNSDRHILLAAPTGTGKTRSLVVCNALLWRESMLVIDIKEEIYKSTAGFRQKKGHICLKFSPLDPDDGIRINPLAWIRFGTKKEAADVQKFAQEIANPGNEGTESAHWNETSMSLLDGVILHEAYKCHLLYNRTVTIKDLDDALSPFVDIKASDEDIEDGKKAKSFNKGFTDYLKEMATFCHDPEGVHGWKDSKGGKTQTHPIVRNKAMEALQRPDDEAGSVLSTAKKRFRLYSDPLIQQATSGCDLEIEDLVDHINPVSLYLVLPPSEKERLSPLVRIVLLMILARLTEKVVPRKHELLVLADEFPSLGYVKPMESALSYVRGYGIRCFIIVQNLSQINKHYGPDNDLISNCQDKIFFTIGDQKTAETTSKEMGPQTIQHAAINFAPNKGRTRGRVEAQSAHVMNTKRDLMEASELERLELPKKVGKDVVAPGECIVLVFGSMPIKGVQVFSFLDPTFNAWTQIKPIDQSRALQKVDLVQEAFA